MQTATRFIIATSAGFARGIAQRGEDGYSTAASAFRDLDFLQHEGDLGLKVFRVEVRRLATHDGVIRTIGAVTEEIREPAAGSLGLLLAALVVITSTAPSPALAGDGWSAGEVGWAVAIALWAGGIIGGVTMAIIAAGSRADQRPGIPIRRSRGSPCRLVVGERITCMECGAESDPGDDALPSCSLGDWSR